MFVELMLVVKRCLFANSPIGAIMQDGGKRERSNHLKVDFITKLLLVVEKDVILIVCDRLSKITHFVATMKRILIESLARLFRDNIWKIYGFPEGMISDRGLQFVVELTKELNKMLGIEMRLLMVFYPQIDRQTEQMNQELE